MCLETGDGLCRMKSGGKRGLGRRIRWVSGQVPSGPSRKSVGRSGWVGRLDLAREGAVVFRTGKEGPGRGLEIGSSIVRGRQTQWGTGYGTRAAYDGLGRRHGKEGKNAYS